MNIADTIAKATLLATCIFWVIIFSENLEEQLILYIFLSIIPIGICCAITIIFTIAPFFWFCKKNNKIVFQLFFPFYAIVSFSMCSYGFIETPDIICFWAAAFFTSLQSWVWIAKKKES